MTKVNRVLELLKVVDYEGKEKRTVDAWIAADVGCSVSLVQKLRVGWYQKIHPGDKRVLMRDIVAKRNQEMASKWKAPRRVK